MKLSDYVDLLQALIALASAYLLYKTLKSQQLSAEIERKSKVGEHLPEFNGKIDPFYPGGPDGYGGRSDEPFNGEDTRINILIEVNKNAIQLTDFVLIDTSNKITKELDQSYFDNKRLFVPGDTFEISCKINLKSYFKIEGDYSRKGASDLVEIAIPTFRSDLNLDGMLYFSDVIGNKYKMLLKINLERIEFSNLKMID
ncbi:hypothetical protein [Sphingobacterium multivorum]|uniref:hypothetical protein n=1 Tax=Sphingobacterium multivorum TaxID=28454 RepID=UPI0036976100